MSLKDMNVIVTWRKPLPEALMESSRTPGLVRAGTRAVG
jgi:hypothetical protein